MSPSNPAFVHSFMSGKKPTNTTTLTYPKLSSTYQEAELELVMMATSVYIPFLLGSSGNGLPEALMSG